MDLYAEIILDHFKHPRHEGLLEKPDIHAEDTNPLCGDKVKVDLRVDGEKKVCDIGFLGEGCAISKASTSILTDELLGKSLDDIENFSQDQLYELIGIEVSPARVKCALLGLSTIKKGIKIYKAEQNIH
jgi:nitrogen fixation NifU-like protein